MVKVTSFIVKLRVIIVNVVMLNVVALTTKQRWYSETIDTSGVI